MNKSKLLLDEQPLLIMKMLAKRIGLNESIVLQQIHYWNEINSKANNNYRDGHYWTYNTYEEWQEQFPFWSVSTIQRTIKNLEKLKLVVTGNYNKIKIDRTKWYRIDYNALQTLETSPFGQIDMTNMSDWHDHLLKMNRPLPKTNTKTTAKNTSSTSSADDEYIFFSDLPQNDYVKQVNSLLDTGRGRITKRNYDKCYDYLQDMADFDGVDFIRECIDRYIQDKATGRSVENFIGHCERYKAGM